MVRLAACAAAALALSAAPAVAQETDAGIERARQLFRQADFTGAREAFEAVLGAEPSDAERSVAHVHLASVAIVFGELDEARAHAFRAVVHDRQVASPPGAPRALEAMLGEARERLAALTLDLGGRVLERGRALVELTLSPAAASPVTELVLACRADRGAVRVERGEPPRLAVEVERRPLQCRGHAGDESGAILARVERDLFPEPEPSPGAPPTARAPILPTEEARDGDAGSPLLPIAIASAVVLVGAVVLVAVAASPDEPKRASFRGTQIVGWP